MRVLSVVVHVLRFAFLAQLCGPPPCWALPSGAMATFRARPDSIPLRVRLAFAAAALALLVPPPRVSLRHALARGPDRLLLQLLSPLRLRIRPRPQPCSARLLSPTGDRLFFPLGWFSFLFVAIFGRVVRVSCDPWHSPFSAEMKRKMNGILTALSRSNLEPLIEGQRIEYQSAVSSVC